MSRVLISDKVSASDIFELNDLYLKNHWSDGLPILPPTEERVWAMLDYMGLEPETILGTVPERSRDVTAEKVAINAVMAGCLPQYMPVLVAVMEAMTDPAFGVNGVIATTSGTAVLSIVSGPIANEIGLNAEENVLSPGWRANATIGRAISLISKNILGSIPGIWDRSTIGNPAKYSFCIAELEEGIPWEPLRVELGFPKESSAVTVFPGQAPVKRRYGKHWANKAEPMLTNLARTMANLHISRYGMASAVVLISGGAVNELVRDGWTKQSIRQFLYEHACWSLADLKQFGAGRLKEIGGYDILADIVPGDEKKMFSILDSPEALLIVPAGGFNAPETAVVMSQAEYKVEFVPVTKEIKPRK